MKIRKLITVVAALGILGMAGVAYAATFKTPAEITAAITGKSVTEVNQERAAGKSYGAIATEAGKLDEFQKQILAQKKAILDERVKEGVLTQQQADQIYEATKTRQATCNGTGLGQGGCGMGLGQGACGGAGFGRNGNAGFGGGRLGRGI